jgi:lipoprotein-anchoring transpeptidase ErfK/SrfK
MMKKASLPALGYTSVREAVAERFHVKEDLLQRLNAKSQFKEGDVIKVPDVEPFNAAAKPSAGPARSNGVARSGSAGATDRAARANDAGRAASPSARGASASARTDLVVTVTDANKSLTVEDGTGKVVFFAPVTVGSQNDPLPVGEWKVNGVQHHPPFNYNPDLFWDADPTHSKAKLAPGPNNPVGTVWIDLSKEHYGIHGTPEPSRIGHTESHGCIRLTNWDAARLASLVGPGTKVILR